MKDRRQQIYCFLNMIHGWVPSLLRWQAQMCEELFFSSVASWHIVCHACCFDVSLHSVLISLPFQHQPGTIPLNLAANRKYIAIFWLLDGFLLRGINKSSALLWGFYFGFSIFSPKLMSLLIKPGNLFGMFLSRHMDKHIKYIAFYEFHLWDVHSLAYCQLLSR